MIPYTDMSNAYGQKSRLLRSLARGDTSSIQARYQLDGVVFSLGVAVTPDVR